MSLGDDTVTTMITITDHEYASGNWKTNSTCSILYSTDLYAGVVLVCKNVLCKCKLQTHAHTHSFLSKSQTVVIREVMRKVDYDLRYEIRFDSDIDFFCSAVL